MAFVPSTTSRSLAGGLDLDPDLPIELYDQNRPDLHGLHVLRHLRRYTESLGMEIVIIGTVDNCSDSKLMFPDDTAVARRELRRYRRVPRRADAAAALEEPHVLPLLVAAGTSCVGLRDVVWEGWGLDEHLHPGRLIGVAYRFPVMRLRANPLPSELGVLHLCAWAPPFPTHAVVSWVAPATLVTEPLEVAMSERLGQTLLRRPPWRR